MKTSFITIGLAVLITATTLFPDNVIAKERKLCVFEFCFLNEAEDSSNLLMDWMVNPHYFLATDIVTKESGSELEDWMLDIQYFNSPVFSENERENEVIEGWMKRKSHFYSSLKTPIASRFQRLDNHMGVIKVVIARR